MIINGTPIILTINNEQSRLRGGHSWQWHERTVGRGQWREEAARLREGAWDSQRGP